MDWVVSRRRLAPWGIPVLGLAAALLLLASLGLFRWLLAANDPPPADPPPQELYLDFRGGRLPPPSLCRWSGSDGDEVIEPEGGGLRIRLAADHQHKFPVGLALTATLKGNFEVTTGYEIVGTDKPRTGGGVGYELYVTTESTGRDALVFARVTLPDGQDTYIYGRNTTVNGQRKYLLNRSPPADAAKAGRLRLTRQGTEVVFWAAEGAGAEFRSLGRIELGPEDVNLVRMSAYAGQAPEAVDVRLVDLRVRSDAPISVPAADEPPGGGMKKGVALAVVLGAAFLVALLALAAWFLRPHRTPGGTPPPEPVRGKEEGAGAGAGSPVITFVCPGCKGGIKSRADQAGKKGKCPRCGKAILVPAAGAVRAGRQPS